MRWCSMLGTYCSCFTDWSTLDYTMSTWAFIEILSFAHFDRPI